MVRPRSEHVRRPGTRRGYDIWAPHYDAETSPLLALDRRWAPDYLTPRRGERILDAGCGTGRHFAALSEAGAMAVGIDFSHGMLRVARRRAPGTRLAAADLDSPLPFPDRTFDAVLCSLVSEHLTRVDLFFSEVKRTLRPGGRLVFSAFHPDMAAQGIEANFELDGIEYRLGAELHTRREYLSHLLAAGLHGPEAHDLQPDDRLLARVPAAAKYRGCNLLLLITARR